MSKAILPKGALRPAEAVVRNHIVDLGMIGTPDAGYEDVLEPSLWAKLADDLKIGDEVRVLASDRSWERTVRIESVGPGGAVVQHLDGRQTAPPATHLFLCRQRADTPHMFGLYSREGEDPDFRWRRLCPGQTNVAVLVEESIRLVSRDPKPDFTLTPRDIESMKATAGSHDEDDPFGGAPGLTTILCPEGGDTPSDRWIDVGRSRGRTWADAAGRFHERALGEQILKTLGSERQFGDGKPDFKAFESASRRTSGGDTWVRPRWKARALCPELFPQRPSPPEEHERAAAAKREAFLLSRNLAAKRAASHAKQDAALKEFEAMTQAKKALAE